MGISFQWKEYVYEVYRERSISKAAQNLYISQPALSARIKSIETELGAPLFDRSTTPLKLTDVGEMYIQAAEEIFQIEQRMETYINSVLSLKTGHISIGASTLFAAYVLPSLITKFKKKYPDIQIHVVEGNTNRLEEMIEENKVDFVIDNYEYDKNLYSRVPYCMENILLAVPSNYPINENLKNYQLDYQSIVAQTVPEDFPAVPLEVFREYPFIMLTPGNDTRIRGIRMCQNAGFKPDIILEFNQQMTAYMAASTKLGVTFISDIIVRRMPSFDNLLHYRLDSSQANREVFFYYKKHRKKTIAMEEFIRLIQKKA